MKILVVDNYDSFTYNLVQYLGSLGAELTVKRNDKVSIKEVEEMNPDGILISPGPCTPAEAGVSVEIVKNFYKRTPILGVCLGHQSIGVAFGGKIVRAKRLMHGKVSQIYHTGEGVFKDIPSPFTAVRYHSLVIERESLPEVLKLTAWSEDEEIMGVQHRDYPVYGVQFHPESVLSEHGMDILRNFLELCSVRV
ncbi:aminodeoxychorismate/anthranilate synthase component II [Hydrogenivirga sp. 128-5-R1-1]|uniref:anthranilate synthase component II n=1 Tax=Hydrogenivirga sp. 128-5-R1-1 TaxID=392423 RepID=UPI00015F15B0|nr:aminodeoxychorismate/anthranilate synthase component II [Hydrogenivirga sp. 128-5-R1-1]EDP74781.1 anthranilate synthase component II [Hydrogenivirga sp. 128-5-R1-1]